MLHAGLWSRHLTEITFKRWPTLELEGKRQFTSRTLHDPLRILFCGSDEFSICSLRALNGLRSKPDIVKSIDVICRKDKPTGRGLKILREVPIKKVAAEELRLNVHQIDTFTGWEPPKPNGEPINLVIAVSFGLLVPPRILNGAKYGGLNVHPSMLPNLRGPAPIQWTLLNGLERTGVTVQTLHPEHFDQGRIVDQTSQPGIAIPDFEKATYSSLLSFVGSLGANLLRHSIATGSFVASADQHRGHYQSLTSNKEFEYLHAPKITPQDRQVDWAVWTSSELLLRDRVIGTLWDEAAFALLQGKHENEAATKRISYHDWEDVTGSTHEAVTLGQLVRTEVFAARVSFEWRLCFRMTDGRVVSPREVTVAGKRRASTASLVHNTVERLRSSS